MTYVGVIDCCIMLFCSSFHIMQSIVVHIYFFFKDIILTYTYIFFQDIILT